MTGRIASRQVDWPQRRYFAANSARRFSSLAEFLRFLTGLLLGACDCDGRGCYVCISTDAMKEAADQLDLQQEEIALLKSEKNKAWRLIHEIETKQT